MITNKRKEVLQEDIDWLVENVIADRNKPIQDLADEIVADNRRCPHEHELTDEESVYIQVEAQKQLIQADQIERANSAV